MENQNQTYTLLLVDDDPDNLEIMRYYLSRAGFKVLLTEDGEQALQCVAQSRPDMLLLDIRMPGLDGMEVCRRLKADETTCDIPIIFLSGVIEPEEKVAALALGAVDYVTKPFHPGEVVARVEKHLALHQMQKRLEERNAQLEAEIAERKQIEADLRLTRFMVNQAADAVCWLDETAHFVDVNETACRILGYSRQEFLQLSVYDIDPDITVELWQEGWQLLKQMGARTTEWTHRAKDGRLIPVEITANYIEFGGRALNCAFARDITERRSAEDLLKTRLHLSEFATTHSLNELLQETLDEAERLTGSQVGFFHFVEADQNTLSLQTWSTHTLTKMCTAEGSGLHYPVAEAGVWADSLRERRTVIHNHYASLPDRKELPSGHAPISRELVTPVLRGEQIVALLGVGNKITDYDARDLKIVTQLANTAWDIVLRKRAEESLRESEERLRAFIDNAESLVWIKDLDGRFLVVNRYTENVLGLPASQIVGHTVFELFPQDIAAPFADNDRQVLDSGEAMEFEEIGKLYDRQRTYISVKFPLRDSAGRVYALGAICTDITERKRVEEELRASEARFSTVFRASPLSISIVRFRDDQYVDVNDAWLTMLGYSRAEVIGRTPYELNLWVDPGNREPLIEQIRQHGAVQGYEVHIRQKSGGVIDLLMSVELIEVAGELCVLSIALDITERKQAEEALRENEEWLRLGFEVANLGAWRNDLVTDRVHFDARAQTFYGFDTNDLSLAEVFTHVHPADRLRVQQEIAVSLDPAGDGRYATKFRVLHDDGSIHWLAVRAQVYFEGHGAARRPILRVGTSQDITAQEEMAEALKVSLEKYRLLFEAFPLGITISDNAGQIVEANRESERLLSLPVDAHTQRAIDGPQWQVIRTDGSPMPPDEYASVRALREGCKIENVEMGIVKGPRQVTWINVTAAPIPLADYGVAITYGDITARKEAELALHESQERYRQLIENSHDLIQRVTPDYRFQFVNRAWLETLEYTEADLPNLTLWDILHADAASRYHQESNLLLAGQSSSLLLLTLKTRSGRAVDVEGMVVPRLVDGQIAAIDAFFRDVTERRQTERIQAAQFAVSRVLAESPELMVALARVLESIATRLEWQVAELWQREAKSSTLARRTAYCCPGQAELEEFVTDSQAYTFAPGQGLTGAVWQQGQALWDSDLVMRPERPRTPLAIRAGLHSATAFPIIIDCETLGVMTFFSRSTRPLDERLLAVLTDLGRQIGQFVARKQAEAELEMERALLAQRVAERTSELSRANAELAQAARSKDEFLANMSHELRTPLNAVLGLSESLQEQIFGPLNERQLKAVATIEQSGRHLLDLINDILDLAKVEAGKLELQPELVEVMDLCQASLAFVKEIANKKNVQLAFHLSDWQVNVEADPRRLKQILVNLLSNAVKFTPVGGQVRLEVIADPAQGVIHFAVQDNGIGIAAEDMAKLFKPFIQLDASLSRQHEGSGLGLALVRRLVDLHGGSVAVTSEGVPGRGSCFTVSLPWPVPAEMATADLHPRDENGARPAEPAVISPSKSKKATILLAEDNEMSIEAIGDYLAYQGYQVIVARDGQEALKLAVENQPDLILMDIQMPGVDGVQATRQLRAISEFATTPIIALTALAMPGDRERCLAAGANEYLPKPVNLRGLLETMAGLLSG